MKSYNSTDLKYDLLGGVSVAALSIPVSVAYSEIVGLPPESGLYTAILALIAYFILGGSRQVIIGPDSAAITVFATTVVALTGDSSSSLPQFVMMITVMTGVLMFAGGLLRLGFISNFLSKPIMAGFTNGIAIVLIVGQFGKLTGIAVEHSGPFHRLLEIYEKAGLINMPTLVLGILSIAFLYLTHRISRKIPGPLLLLFITALVGLSYDFGSHGISMMKEIENPYPSFIVPDFTLFTEHFSDIMVAAAAMMFVSFSGEMPVVKGVVADTKEHVDPDKEFFALGLADILAGFFRGYPVSGAGSRTAVNVSVGGRTKAVSLIAAGLILAATILFPASFDLFPLVSFAAIIVFAAVGMFRSGAGLRLYRRDKGEYLIFLVCMLGVLVLGVYQGILLAVVLSLLQILRKASRPREFELAYAPDTRLLSEQLDGSEADDTTLIYRFDSALLFFNAGYFAETLSKRASSKKNLRLIVIEAEPINNVDLTGLAILSELLGEFAKERIKVVFAGASESTRSSITAELEARGLDLDVFYPNVESVFCGS